MPSPVMHRKLDASFAGRSCGARRRMPQQAGRQADSSRLYVELEHSGRRLVDAIAAEKRVNAAGLENPNDSTIPERWSFARSRVAEAADYYVIALENYREAAVSEAARSQIEALH